MVPGWLTLIVLLLVVFAVLWKREQRPRCRTCGEVVWKFASRCHRCGHEL